MNARAETQPAGDVASCSEERARRASLVRRASAYVRARVRAEGLFDRLFALTLAFAACLAFGAFRHATLPLDDAYIHMAYGKHLHWGSWLSFHGDQPDTGSSSWAWTLLCAASEKLGLHTPTVLLLCGIFALAWILHLTIAFGRHVLPESLVGRRLWPYAGALLVAANGNVLWLTLSGMEAIPTVAVVMAFVHRLQARRVIDGRLALFGLLMLWLRVETVVWLAGVPLLMLVSRRRPRGRLGWALVPLAGLALQLGYHLALAGSLLPTSSAAKGATFVPTSPSPSAALDFLYRVDRDYLDNFLEGWQLELRVLAPAALVLGCAVAYRLLRRRGAGLGDAQLATAGLLGGALVQTLAYVLTFRTAYHHLRYFAPLLVLCSALVVPLTALALHVAWSTLRGATTRRGAPARTLLLGAPVAWLAGHALCLELLGVGTWAGIYASNCAQLAAVHTATASWLGAHASELRHPSVASFDIGVLRYVSGLGSVDLGGVLDPNVLRFRQARDNAGLVAEARPSIYVSLDNGFDRLPRRDPKGRFTLERLATFAFPEYADPVPPHSKRMEVFLVNHCGEPRRVRSAVGDGLGFEPSEPRPDAEWEGTSFEGESGGAASGLETRGAEGADFLTSYHPDARDAATGVWRGPWLDVSASHLRFLVAGGHDPERLRVELVDDGEAVVAAWTGYGHDSFIEVVQPLGDLAGRRVRLVVRDDATSDWGHISIDGARQFDWTDAPAVACPGSTPARPGPAPLARPLPRRRRAG
ncbi:MAG: hypothetical protein HY908_30240 [Myxococcales bacterium]|nr:hypothetical protein [Myxococcales bacterium]